MTDSVGFGIFGLVASLFLVFFCTHMVIRTTRGQMRIWMVLAMANMIGVLFWTAGILGRT